MNLYVSIAWNRTREKHASEVRGIPRKLVEEGTD